MMISVEMDKGEGAEENSNEGKVGTCERTEVQEPYVGLEFNTEDEARKFYFDYARRIGFVVRMMQRRISETDKKVIARRLGCNKQGYSPNYGTIGPDNKPRPSAREGCRATILVKLEKSGKWVVSRFEKEHNHPLVVTEQGPSTTVDFSPRVNADKDKKIEFLIRELRRQDQLCASYREKLLKFLNSIEEQTDQLSSKIQDVVDNVRKVEAEEQQQLPQHR
ncbi:hypothetical protein Vadar_001087 [Vaccinium darrowii]|uniref:Uncharacterized protein n=1 Tax=Vaccinium darrowii TaxID=229202 RepID=A0ACB7X6P4_9ERIC|nr:hypothetical protein Vadar_001087 [Vaccinium darrowii]